jgi:hypothetical protein
MKTPVRDGGCRSLPLLSPDTVRASVAEHLLSTVVTARKDCFGFRA